MIIALLYICFLTINLSACQQFEEKTYDQPIPENLECYIGADVCGKMSDFGVFSTTDNIPTLLFSLHIKTRSIKDFPKLMSDIMVHAQDKYKLTITHASIGAPGVATDKKDFASVYGDFDIDSKEVIKQTGLAQVIVINDLVAMGHGLDAVDRNKIVQVYGQEPKEHGIRALIGAKAGLGSCTQIWNERTQEYVTHPGEGGCVEFASHGHFEAALVDHMRGMYDTKVIYWDAFVSGCGIKRIYSMLRLMGTHHDSLKLDPVVPAEIFAHPEDALCKVTIDLFFKLYARFTRNHVLPALPFGGLFMTGSVAAKNVDLFAPLFVPAYEECQSCIRNILKRIPVYVVTDENVSLYGAVRYLLNEKNRDQ